jgi:hypothetical protein
MQSSVTDCYNLFYIHVIFDYRPLSLPDEDDFEVDDGCDYYEDIMYMQVTGVEPRHCNLSPGTHGIGSVSPTASIAWYTRTRPRIPHGTATRAVTQWKLWFHWLASSWWQDCCNLYARHVRLIWILLVYIEEDLNGVVYFGYHYTSVVKSNINFQILTWNINIHTWRYSFITLPDCQCV